MPADLANALDRFLGRGSTPLQTAIVRQVARFAVTAWRDGLITTSQALHSLGESHDAMRAHARQT
jgi:hypothetical protein